MPTIKHALTKVQKRKLRVRSKLSGTAQRPRVTVFRSNKYTYMQAVDDDSQKTIIATSDLSTRKDKKTTATKKELAALAAAELAKGLKAKKITAVVFDRGQYKYHGRVSVIAETLRAQGIEV